MNKERRKQLETQKGKLEGIKLDIESIQGEEQEAFDAMPEGPQNSERGERMQNSIDAIESAMSAIDEALDELQNAIEG